MARCLQSIWHEAGRSRSTLKRNSRRPKMFMTNTANNVLAAAISVSISAALFAYAIIPASPAVFA